MLFAICGLQPVEFSLVRLILTLMLTCILGACPILCGTGGAMLGLRVHEHGPGHPGDAPVNDDDCLCNGAIGVWAGAASHAVDALSAPVALLAEPFGMPTPVSLTALAHRADASPPGVPRRHDLLQSCRC